MISQPLAKHLIGKPVSVDPHVADSLRAAAGGGMQIGCAVDGVLPSSLTDPELRLLCRHFDALTPENCMKPANIQPEEGRFRFEAPDALIRFAQANQLQVVGHCLLWHQQCPDWFFKDGHAPAGRELILDRMRRHINALAGRYRGKIQGWDVVNEAIADQGDFLRETPWLAHVGEDFVIKAFEYAHEADPHAELYYNDFNIELPDKRDRTLRLLRQLQQSGARLDGVGIQGHWVLDQVPMAEIEAAIIAYHRLGLKVMITELDLDVVERPDCGADVSLHHDYSVAVDPYPDGCPSEILERQAAQYEALFRLFRKHRDKVTRVSFWGLHDGRSWLNEWPGKRTNHPLLFDRQCRPKTAFGRIARALA